jgi:hypothetical protein
VPIDTQVSSGKMFTLPVSQAAARIARTVLPRRTSHPGFAKTCG